MTGEKKLSHEPMLELYIYETGTLVEQLEEIIIGMEAKRNMGASELERILNALHAIKSASAMMLFPHTARAAHAVEDLFSRFKEEIPVALDYESICDLVLETLDFIKREIRRAAEGLEPEGACTVLVDRVAELTAHYGADGTDKKPETPLGQKYYITHAAYKEHTNRCYHAKITFEKNCQMENIRAFTVVHNLREGCRELYHRPNDLIRDVSSSAWIIRNGFHLYFSTELSEAEIRSAIEDAILIKEYTLEPVEGLSPYTYDLRPSTSAIKGREVPEPFSVSADIPDDKWTAPENHLGLDSGETITISKEKLVSLSQIAAEIVKEEATFAENRYWTDPMPPDIRQTLCRLKNLAERMDQLVQGIGHSGRYDM